MPFQKGGKKDSYLPPLKVYPSPLTLLSPTDLTRYLCKQCRSWWDGSQRAVSSGFTLFAILFRSVDWRPLNKGYVHIQWWNSPFQKLSVDRVNTWNHCFLWISLVSLVSSVVRPRLEIYCLLWICWCSRVSNLSNKSQGNWQHHACLP